MFHVKHNTVKKERKNTMTEIKSGTKKQLEVINTWYKNEGHDLRMVYGRCSREKEESYLNILRRALATDGYQNDLHICSHNTFSYTTAYSYMLDNKLHIVVDTKDNTYHTVVA